MLSFHGGIKKAPSKNEGNLGDRRMEGAPGGTLAITWCPPGNTKETEPQEARSRPRSQAELGLQAGSPPHSVPFFLILGRAESKVMLAQRLLQRGPPEALGQRGRDRRRGLRVGAERHGVDPAVHIRQDSSVAGASPALCLEKPPAPDVPPMSMALRFRALMMFTMMELAEGL